MDVTTGGLQILLEKFEMLKEIGVKGKILTGMLFSFTASFTRDLCVALCSGSVILQIQSQNVLTSQAQGDFSTVSSLHSWRKPVQVTRTFFATLVSDG